MIKTLSKSGNGGMFFMKSFTRRVDRFCYTHPNFGIQNLMMYIIDRKSTRLNSSH